MSIRVPTGVSDFRKIRELGAYYVDKSDFIRGVLASGAEAMLFLRPRRFGKTTNLSALRWFLENNGEPIAGLFHGLKVWNDPSVRDHFQRYPVISLTFKDTRVDSAPELEKRILHLVVEEFRRHRELETSSRLSSLDRADYMRIASGAATSLDTERALFSLSRWLREHHGTQVVILIDEYDVPIHAGLLHGYADRALEFFRNFFSAGLKDNPYLFKGVMTGVLRVAKESIFSGLNNLAVYGATRADFGTEFGFTATEVRSLLEGIGRPELLESVAEWYDGYSFGPERIYNPWSVMSFVDSSDKVLRPHWRSTGSEDLLRDLLLRRGLGLREEMESLLKGEPIQVVIEESVALRDLEQRPNAIWSFLVYSGYLTADNLEYEPAGTLTARVRIPNREVRGTYTSIFSEWLGDLAGGSVATQEMIEALLRGDVQRFEARLTELVQRVLSFHDPAGREAERGHHAFLLGLLVQLEGRFDVRSNRESGMGRADILLLPKSRGEPGLVLELKRVKLGQSMDEALEDALRQAHSRDYGAELRARNASPISLVAIAFEGKRVAVRTETDAKG